MDPWEFLQFAGSTLFVVSLIPQFIRTVQRGRADDVSAIFTIVVLLASLIMVPYALHTEQWYLTGNYVANLGGWGTVLYYRFSPRPAPTTAPSPKG